EDVTLDEAAAEVADELQFLWRFNTFSGRLHLEVGRQADHRPDQRGVAALQVRGAGDEGAVDLDLVERDALQVAQRRIAGAEVVKRERSEERRVGKECRSG